MTARGDDDLLHAYLDGTLAEAEVAALEARLRVEPALADSLLRLSREDAVMREWAASSATAEAVTRVAEPASPRRRSRLVSFIAIPTAAAAIVLALLIWQVPRGTGPSLGKAVALLEDVQGEVTVVAPDGATELAQNGQTLFAGQEIQTGEDDGSAVVRVQDSWMMLGAETRLKIGDSNAGAATFFLAEGMVSAEAVHRPLVLRSLLAEVHGRDGRFRFVSMPGAALVETDDGQARLTRKSDGRSVDVKRGQFAAVKPDGKSLEPVTLVSRVTQPRRTISIGGGPVHGLSFEPDGTSLLTCTAESLKRWDAGTGKLTSIVYGQKKRAIRTFAGSGDGRVLALNNDEKQVRILDSTGAERRTFKGPRRVAALAMPPGGQTLAVSWSAKDGHEVRIYDVLLGIERVLHTGHTSAVTGLAYSPHGNVLATAGDRTVRLWEADLDPIRTLPKLSNEPRGLAFSPDNRTLAIGDRKGNVWVFDTAAGSLRLSLGGHLRDVTALAFSPDGRLLASASADGTSRLWDVATGRELASFKGHGGAVTSVAFSLDGRLLATGGQDRKVLFWDVPPAGPAH